MKKRRVWVIAIVGLLSVVGALAGIKAGQFRTLAAMGQHFSVPPEAVTSDAVESAQWRSIRSAVGTLVAVRGVVLGAELGGTIREIGFDSAALVKKGALLVRLDTSVEEAQLQAAAADATLARLALARTRTLKEKDAVTQADLDAAEGRAAQADAVAQGLRATIARKTIRAPFSGRVAIRQVELGEVVSPGTALASLQSVDPIFADFWLPQQALADLQPGQPVHLRSDIFPTASWEGAVSVINTEVDLATRNVRVRASLPNPDGRLRPGMYVNLEVVSPQARSVRSIPATSVLFAPYGDSVFTLSEQGGQTFARQKFVRLGERRGDWVEVLSGLEAGEAVVSSGAFKLRNGAAVVVKDRLTPKAELTPRPTEQ
jgi:membrane fusion protein, multidrug efflux system